MYTAVNHLNDFFKTFTQLRNYAFDFSCPSRRPLGSHTHTFCFSRDLTLNDILEHLECNIDEIPDSRINIAMFPPLDFDADLTDEDSGSEEAPTLDNISRSQLNAPAGVDITGNNQKDMDEKENSQSNVVSQTNISGQSENETPQASSSNPWKRSRFERAWVVGKEFEPDWHLMPQQQDNIASQLKDPMMTQFTNQ